MIHPFCLLKSSSPNFFVSCLPPYPILFSQIQEHKQISPQITYFPQLSHSSFPHHFSILFHSPLNPTLLLLIIIKTMIQTERDLIDKQPQYNYYDNPQVQSPPTFLNKFLFFNRLAMLKQYITKISRETIFRYNDSFEPMFSTNRILSKFSKSKRKHDPFSIVSEIFRMQQRAIITIVILSLLAGLTSLVPIYFQFILVKAVMGNTGNYYSLSVIVCVMFLRFILLNYVLSLSNNISLNIKIYMQNTFMRAAFACNNFSPSAKYLDVDLIGQAFYYIPYLITSQIIIIGDVVFVFLQVGVYGCIVMGIYLALYVFIIGCGRVAFQIMKENSSHRVEREKFQKKSLTGLMRVALQRVHDYVFRLLVVERTLQMRQNLKINILYITAQTFGECCVVLSNITLYALTNQHGVASISSYYSVLFMVACFYPMRYSVYGMFTIIKGYQAFLRINEEFANVHLADLQSLPDSDHQVHIFAQNMGDCFEYPYKQIETDDEDRQRLNAQKQASQQQAEMNNHNDHEIRSLASLREGEVLMVLTRVDSRPTSSEFLKEISQSKPSDKSLLMINNAHFVLPMSLKDNILYYSPYDQQKFKRILEITQLNSLPTSIWAETNLLDQKSLKYNQWHQSRIQLARALYNNVDYLILNKQNLFDDLSLLTAVFAERRANKKITIVANNTHKFFFKLADRVLAIGRRGEQEVGIYSELRMKRQSLFNHMFLRHHEKVDHSARVIEERKDNVAGTLHLYRKQPKEVHLQKSTFFEFFNFVHRKAEFIVIVGLFLPVCFKYYLQYLIGTSVTVNIFWRYLIFGLIYIFFIFMRGFIIAFYTNFSSLSLYRKICRKLKRLNAHQILEFYEKPHTDFDFHSRIIDRNLVMDFQYGQSILIEIIVSFIVYCTGQPAYIAVAIPIIIGIVYINGYYAKNARAIYLLKLKQTKGINRLIATAVERSESIGKSLKANEFNNDFHKKNRIEIIYDSNIQWLQTGVRTLAELLVWLAFIAFLIIMIYTVQNISIYTSLVSLGCSMFINLMYLNTFYLKAFRQTEISLFSLTLCMNFLHDEPHPTPRQIMRVLQPQKIKLIEFVQSIQLKKISLRYFKNVCDKVDMKIQGGDRLVVSGNSNTFKEILFYIFDNKLFDCTDIKGDLLINGEVQREFHIDGLFYLHSNPILPFLGTVYEAVRYTKHGIEEAQLDRQLAQFFEIMDLVPVFNSNTEVSSLSIDQKQLFEVFRVVIVEECKILVIIDGLDNIDIVSRRKLLKYLIKKKSINIIIQTTNVREMVELYPKQYVFQGLKLRLQSDKQPHLDELYLKKLETGNQESKMSSMSDKKEEKEFDSMLRIELNKETQRGNEKQE